MSQMAVWVTLAGGLGTAGLLAWALCRVARRADDQSAAFMAEYRSVQHQRMARLCGAAPATYGGGAELWGTWKPGDMNSPPFGVSVTASALPGCPTAEEAERILANFEKSFPKARAFMAADYAKVEERVLAAALAEPAPGSKAVGICVYCGCVVDFISDSWIKRETDGVYCTANTAGFPAGRYGKHSARVEAQHG